MKATLDMSEEMCQRRHLLFKKANPDERSLLVKDLWRTCDCVLAKVAQTLKIDPKTAKKYKEWVEKEHALLSSLARSSFSYSL